MEKVLEAGPEMNALVAEKLGAKHKGDPATCNGFGCPVCKAKGYSTSLDHAWHLLGILRHAYGRVEIIWIDGGKEYPDYMVMIRNEMWGHGETAPEAICRAFLRALEWAADRLRICEGD